MPNPSIEYKSLEEIASKLLLANLLLFYTELRRETIHSLFSEIEKLNSEIALIDQLEKKLGTKLERIYETQKILENYRKQEGYEPNTGVLKFLEWVKGKNELIIRRDKLVNELKESFNDIRQKVFLTLNYYKVLMSPNFLLEPPTDPAVLVLKKAWHEKKIAEEANSFAIVPYERNDCSVQFWQLRQNIDTVNHAMPQQGPGTP